MWEILVFIALVGFVGVLVYLAFDAAHHAGKTKNQP